MRHRKIKGRLNRRTSWRKATLKCLANDLLEYQRIETTFVKAKALRMFVEPIITTAKKNPDCINARRRVFQKLADKRIIKLLFDDIAPLFKDTPGGYTRVLALGNRRGDGAKMAIVELTKRTISDEKLLGLEAKLEKTKTASKKGKAAKDSVESDTTDKAVDEKSPQAPEVKKKAKPMVKDDKKARLKSDSKKGIFKRFRRKTTD